MLMVASDVIEKIHMIRKICMPRILDSEMGGILIK